MPLKSNLTDKEFIDFLHCRVNALELYISAIHPYFNEWIDAWISTELDSDSSLTEAEKTKLKSLATDIKNKFKRKD